MKNKKIVTPPGYVPSAQETQQEVDKTAKVKQEIDESDKKDMMIKNV